MIPAPPTRRDLADMEAARRDRARAREARAQQESARVAADRARRIAVHDSDVRRHQQLTRLSLDFAAECHADDARARTERAYRERVLAVGDHRVTGWRERRDQNIHCPDRDPASGLFREETS